MNARMYLLTASDGSPPFCPRKIDLNAPHGCRNTITFVVQHSYGHLIVVDCKAMHLENAMCVIAVVAKNEPIEKWRPVLMRPVLAAGMIP